MWSTFEALQWPIQRVDLWRYFVLHDFGGIYCDLDIMPVKSIEEALQDLPGDVFLVKSANEKSTFTNALMISALNERSKAFWASMIAYVTKWTSEGPSTSKDKLMQLSRHMEIMISTGPLALTRVIEDSKYAITVLPQSRWNAYDLTHAGLLEDQQDTEALFKILEGSSWHSTDSSILSFLHMYKKHILVLLILVGLYYVIASQIIRQKFYSLLSKFKKK
jgi:mannosyltransferase OCH1-like enzyme